MLRAGIIGLPNAGKSTTFNVMTGGEALTAPFPFSTIDPNRSLMKIYDEDFMDLARSVSAKDLKYSEVEVIDIAGLIKGASDGEGLGNEFLGQMKDVDVLLHVVKIDSDSTIATVHEDIEIVENEIAQFDYRILRKPFEKARRLVKLYPKNKAHSEYDEVVSAAFYGARDGVPIAQSVDLGRLTMLQDLGLVSLKSKILVANIDGSQNSQDVLTRVPADVHFNALELEQLSGLDPNERQELGFKDNEVELALGAMSRLILKAALMKRFYTVGHLGVGQWVTSANANAIECAGLIHESMKSEVRSVKVAKLEDFKFETTWQLLAKKGLIKSFSASKYIPSDRDVLLFE